MSIRTELDNLPATNPGRRMLSTICRRPRNLSKLASPIRFDPARAERPELDELAHRGEVCLLEDDLMALHRDGTCTTSRHVVTMLHGDQNLASWDEVGLAYDRRRFRPTVRRARAHLPDGHAYDAQQSNQRLKGTTPESATNVINVAFPYLRPGTIVEWECQEDYFRANQAADGLWGNFFLQDYVPCRHRRITLAVAKPFEAQIRIHNTTHAPTEYDVGEYRVYQWELKDVPALEFEAGVPPVREFAPWLDVSTLRSWQPIADHFQRDLDSGTPIPADVRHLTAELTRDAGTEREKLFQIHRFLARDVRYGRHPQEMAMSTSREMGGMLVDLRGDCKDKATLMVTMMRELGISAQIGVVLTRDHGITAYLPSNRFNHAIVLARADGEDVWLDPAAGPYTFGELPYADQGARALVLDGARSRMVDVPAAQPTDHGVDRVVGGKLDPDGNYRFETAVTARGDRAAAIRDALLFRAEDFRQSLLMQSVAAAHPGAEVNNVVIDHVDDIRHPLRYSFTMTLPTWGRCIEDLMILSIPWAEPLQWNALFVTADRCLPLDTPGVFSVSEYHAIELPCGFSGYGLPIERDEVCPWATHRCHVRVEGWQLLCERRVQFLGGIASPDEFKQFRRFWESCVRFDREEIVLVKQESAVPRPLTFEKNSEVRV